MALRLALIGCLLALAGGLTACGDEEPGVDEPAREGLALELEGVEYNVFITRQLNPDIQPDEAYTDDEPEPGETSTACSSRSATRTERRRRPRTAS